MVRIMLTKKYECGLCKKELKNKNDLTKHIRRTHGEKKFECNDCGNKFRLKHHLTKHLVSHMRLISHNPTTKYECGICKKELKNKNDLTKHIRRTHGEKKFECNDCGNKFRLRHHLTRHLASHKRLASHKHLAFHKTPTTKYECEICKKELKNQNVLTVHIRRTHGEKKFECNDCGNKFRLRHHLTKHCVLHQTSSTKTIIGYKCGSCFSCFRSKKEIIRHFEKNHEITMKCKQLHFNSKEDFQKFRLDYQCKSTTQFIVRNTWKSLHATSILYICHRSGSYKVKKGVKKFPKMSGLKKVQSYCPAEMYVKLFEDGKCIVNIQESHVGHNIDDPSELCHIYLDPSEKEEIAIQYGVTKNKIQNKQMLMFQEEKKRNELGRLCNQDIYNVVSSFGIQSEYTFPFNDDMLNINTFVEMHGNSVLYYKKLLEEDTKFYALENNDFALVFMNEFQERNLYRYGKNIIVFDNIHIHNTNEYGFLLHSLLIMNINCEGFPVAFLLSNRNDVIIINIFLQCIKDRVGILTPKVIMTDMQPTYKNSWMEVMGSVPDLSLWCPWHVREAWRKNYCKVFNKKIRQQIKNIVQDLADELNLVSFHYKLDTFLSMDDAALEPFITYFRQYYVENEKSQMWAYCYRKDAPINTNMSIEAFHRSLKYNCGQKMKINSLSCTLHCILQYLNKKATEENGIRVRTYKINLLRNRHHVARKKYEKEDVTSKVHVINSNSWLVESFEKPNVMYVVEKKIVKECVQYDSDCRLYCHFCKFCFHEFSCNCVDAHIRNNMCKHIHSVGILEKTHAEDVMYEAEDVMHESESEEVEEIIQLQENQIENMKVEKKRQALIDTFIDSLKKTSDLKLISEIEKRFVQPILPMINAFQLE